MSRLIIDEAAQQLAAARLEGKPIFAGPGGGLLELGVVDLVDRGDPEAWQPADQRTKMLTLAIEACRDMVFHAERLLASPGTARRAIKAMAVPACNLVDVSIQLHSALNSREFHAVRTRWPAKDQATYQEASKRLKKQHFAGALRTARNKISAHLDPEVYETGVNLSLNDVLGAIGDALLVLMLALNHRSAFVWIRFLGTLPSGERVVETMFDYPIATRWLTDLEGKVLDVGILQLAADPACGLHDEVLQSVTIYNRLTSLDGSSMPKMSVEMRDSATTLPDAVRLAGPMK